MSGRRDRWAARGALAATAVLAAVVAVTVVLTPEPRTPDAALRIEGLPGPALASPLVCDRDDDVLLAGAADLVDPTGRVTTAMVIACPALFDGRQVRFAGEVVGDVLRRDGGAWARLNDDAYALEVGPLAAHGALRGANSGLSVWLPDGLHERLGPPGGPGRRGDVLLVTGVLLRADPADAGGLTIRAREVEVLADSVAVSTPVDRRLAVAAAVGAVLAAAAVLDARRRRG